jgi:hypothetical protein
VPGSPNHGLTSGVAHHSLGATGKVPDSARRHARMVQAYELMFWNTLAEGVELAQT